MYAALEIKEDETPHETVEMLMKLAVEKGQPFSVLEVLSTFTLGTMLMLRFKTDCTADIVKHAGKDRACVVAGKGGFRVFDGLDEGPVDSVTMTALGVIHQRRVYRGPAVNFWERQFLVKKT